MEGQNDGEKIEEVMLPGFRFHPTDEELVSFYLRRKVQQRPLSIELIKQLDIYKYDPWDLPKLAMTGEKEWYFYVPRDRKYRNSARPNRVTGAGFWKATGTDRPIYSSDSHKCIGLKKSLVFYKGRAARGIKTDWMMHEFRLPSLSDPASPKKFLEKNIPANESWAICRIFKKTSTSAQRAMSHSFVSSPSVEPNNTSNTVHAKDFNASQLCSDKNIMSITPKTSTSYLHFDNKDSHNHNQRSISTGNAFCSSGMFASYKQNLVTAPVLYTNFEKHPNHTQHLINLPVSHTEDLSSFLLPSPFDTAQLSAKLELDDVSARILNAPFPLTGDYGNIGVDLGGILVSQEEQCPELVTLPYDFDQQNSSCEHNTLPKNQDLGSMGFENSRPDRYWDMIRSVSVGDQHDPLKQSLIFGSSSSPDGVFSCLSTTKCYS